MKINDVVSLLVALALLAAMTVAVAVGWRWGSKLSVPGT